MGLTKEEELLLQDFSKTVSKKSMALFVGNALLVSAAPIWLFCAILEMDFKANALVFAVVTIACTYLISLAYKKTKFPLKHKIAIKREYAITKEMNKKLSEDKTLSRKDRDDRILWRKNEVADFEATTFSIFYNNILFLLMMVVGAFYALGSFSPLVMYIGSMLASAGLVALFSSGTKV